MIDYNPFTECYSLKTRFTKEFIEMLDGTPDVASKIKSTILEEASKELDEFLLRKMRK